MTLVGDGPAVAEVIGTKAPGNAKTPCRFCDIQAVSSAANSGHYYVPNSAYLASRELPPLKVDLRADIDTIMMASTTMQDRVGMSYAMPLLAYANFDQGVTRKSIMHELKAIDFPMSFSIDIMHCILLNGIKHLFRIWTGTLDAIVGDDIRLHKQQLQVLADTVRRSRAQVPYALGDYPTDFLHWKQFTASEWKMFLTTYGADILEGHVEPAVLRNLILLRMIWNRCSRYSITRDELQAIQELTWDFVESYEREYYAMRPELLSVCGVNIHMLLHLHDCIQANGPARGWWSWSIERYCYTTKKAARSKAYINKSQSNGLLMRDVLNQLNLFRTRPHRDMATERYPSILEPLESTALPECGISHRLLLQLRDQVNGFNEAQITYGKRCQVTKQLTVGSKLSQRASDINRDNFRVCFQTTGGLCRFGNVEYFISAIRSHHIQHFAAVRAWNSVEYDPIAPQLIYHGDDRAIWQLVPCESILSLVGVLVEQDRNPNSSLRSTKMIIGAWDWVDKFGVDV